ncbi:hypothetical protein [Streptomyces sp. SID4982]|uniref:hypothetical protein n=1 Tax=Streptomyces sp. SID4982 TaxID=2690291 RepID=UPI00136E7068|nr:hypothetical protein [Streptomyces sp. SID4982]MYS15797.1 hypothetical protein [Streptomyces sp. SID4982]
MPGEEGHRFGDGVVDVLGDVVEETFPAWQKAADDAVDLLRVAAAKAPWLCSRVWAALVHYFGRQQET